MGQFCIALVAAFLLALVTVAASGGDGQPGNHPAAANVNNTALTNSSQGNGSDSGHRPPRGDDPRPRDWGVSNDRGESDFDDRKSPRTVTFLGRSANFRIYPNYSDPSVFLQLRFGKIQELDATGKPVPGHSVPSLAAATNVTFAAGNTTVNGVNMSYVNFTLNPLGLNNFVWNCSARGNGGGGDRRHRHLLRFSRRSLLGQAAAGGLPAGVAAPQVNVSLLFGLDGALTVPYGDVNITIPPNGLKWSVSYANWPFCNTSNTLSVSLNLLVANNVSAQIVSGGGNNGTQVMRLVLGTYYNATLGFVNYALDGAASASSSASAVNATRMPVNVSLGTDDGGVTTVLMGLPNPAAYNITSGAVWYDPTQTTTSAYLSADDPGNVATATVTSTAQSGANGGAAASLRAGAWTAACAVLLSALLTMPTMTRLL